MSAKGGRGGWATCFPEILAKSSVFLQRCKNPRISKKQPAQNGDPQRLGGGGRLMLEKNVFILSVFIFIC